MLAPLGWLRDLVEFPPKPMANRTVNTELDMGQELAEQEAKGAD